MCCLSPSLSRLLLIVFNIIFFVLGLGLIILGIILLVDDNVILEYLGKLPIGSDVVAEGVYGTSWLSNFAYIIIIAGSFFFVVGGAGLFGACCKVECLLIVYATTVLMIVILEIAVGVVAVLYKSKVDSFLQTYMQKTIDDYYNGMTYNDGTVALSSDTTGVSDAWDYAQIQFRCCGVLNQSDWDTATQWNKTMVVSGSAITAVVPVSCCTMTDYSYFPDQLSQITFTDISACLNTGSSAASHTTGCYQAIYDKLKSYSLAIAILGIIVGVIQILGIWASCSLYRALGKEKVEPI